MKKFLLATAMCLISSNVLAVNEYFQNGAGHCQSATVEPYVEWRKNENIGTGTSSSGYDDDSQTFGLRLRIPIGSTCTKEYKRIMITNELLKQQLEMLKLCGRYQDLELGDQFAEVREKCKDVKKKTVKLKEIQDD